MSDQPERDSPPPGGEPATPEAQARPTRFSLIWLIPIVVVAIAAYLGWTTLSRQGPTITIEFDNADGLTAGQTQVKHKAVALGTVQGVQLSHDLKHVDVSVQMSSQSAPLLTSNAKFWVVRPRLSGASISGLETLLSGAFIAIDPGLPGGKPETIFHGMDAPPGLRSDEPGSTFTLKTASLGSLGQGSPVFFRDVSVGEVLGYKMPPDGRGPILVQIFIQAPYDKYVYQHDRFWNVSGIGVVLAGGNLHIQLQSIQALVTGGVAFGPPPDEPNHPPRAEPNSVFRLFASEDAANSSGYRERLPLVTYMSSSVKGLDVGSPVQIYGMQLGNVTGLRLKIDTETGEAKVRVAMEIQPERVQPLSEVRQHSMFAITQALVNRGLRAEISTDSLITGSSAVSMAFVPNAKPMPLSMEGDAIVIPSAPGGLDGIMESVSAVTGKLAALPIEQIGDNLSNLLAHADATVGSPEVKQALVQLNRTMASLQSLTRDADKDLGPVMQRLPGIADQTQQALDKANTALAAYGGNSDFNSTLRHTLDQLNGTLRSVRSLTDYLNRHPSSLIFGRSHP